MMSGLSVTILLLLLSGVGADVLGTENCCFVFYPRRLNMDKIISYHFTGLQCPKPAVVLVTKQSRQICVDPTLSWVQSIMDNLDNGPI